MATTELSPALGLPKAAFDKFKPLNGFVLVQREPEQTVSGKILLLAKGEDDRRREPSVARVIRTGGLEYETKRGRPIPLQCKAGDRIVIDKWGGHDIEVLETGERYVLVGEPDVLCQYVDAA